MYCMWIALNEMNPIECDLKILKTKLFYLIWKRKVRNRDQGLNVFQHFLAIKISLYVIQYNLNTPHQVYLLKMKWLSIIYVNQYKTSSHSTSIETYIVYTKIFSIHRLEADLKVVFKNINNRRKKIVRIKI